MFTPQRKGWQSARSGVGSGLNGRNLSKGKAVAFVDEQPPPLGILSENVEKGLLGFDEGGNGGMEDWRKFREAGMLDEVSMERKDRQALAEKIAKIENELYDYQYNMGILLIEKNKWESKYEELSRVLEETQELLKREKSAHHMVLSEAECREDNLRKALGVERQCVADLEKALRGMQQEYSQGKREAESKFSNANSLVNDVTEKSMEVERKMKIADAKLAEADRKTAELERRLQEVEARENVFQAERSTLKAEREAHEATFRKQKEDLLVWEKKLHEGDVKLCDGRRALRDKEEELIEAERLNKIKERELEVKFDNINSSLADLKPREEDLKSRLSELMMKEERVDAMKRAFEKKEKELLSLEEKLYARERGEIQTLVDEHMVKLDAEWRDLELKMQQKRAEFDQEFKSKFNDIEKKETEITHIEAKLAKREEALDRKIERLKDKEKDTEEKMKILKEKENLFTMEEKKLANENKQLEIDREYLRNVKDEIEQLRSDVTQKKLHLKEEVERLQVTENERNEHNRLQSELKQEIEKCRQNVESLLKEREELRQDREKFEQEWEVLDEKKAEIIEDSRRLEEEKKKFEMERDSEEKRLRSEKVAIQDHLQRELDAVREERESLSASIEKEKFALLDNAEKERKVMLLDLERRMQDFETEVQRRNEEMELQLAKKEKAFQEMQEKELNHVKKLKETVEWETEEWKSERARILKERQELVLNKQQLEINQIEMRKDVEELSILIKKLKDQREQFVKERSHFLTFVEKLRNCLNCGDIVKEFVIVDLQVPELGDTQILPLSISAEELVKQPLGDSTPSGKRLVGNSNGGSNGGQLSWLQKCKSKLFNSPPPRKDNQQAVQSLATSPLFLQKDRAEVHEMENTLGPDAKNVNPISSNALSDDSFSARNDHPNHVSNVDDGHQSEVSASAGKVTQGRGRRKAGRTQKAGLNRTSTMKATVEDAKAFLGKDAEGTDVSTLNLRGSTNMVGESREESEYTEKADSLISRKRGRAQTSKATASEANGGYSEGCSESVGVDGRRKRRQTVTPAAETPVTRRYNLRRHKNAALATPADSADVTKDVKEIAVRVTTAAANAKDPQEDIIADGEASRAQVTTIRSEVQEVSSGIAARFARITSGFGESDDPAEVAVIKETFEVATSRVLPTNYEEDQNVSVIHDDLDYEDDGLEEDDDDDDDDGDDDDQPGQASVGKKLWNFFTT